MFKLQNKLQSMDVNKNIERYKFNPGHRGFVNSKYRINKTFDKYANTENRKLNIRDSLYNKMNRIPPVFFYRKVSNPYKYSMTAVPEYLIKTNEEKYFIDKLYQSLTDESDKNTLNNLINRKKADSRKDFYKPQYVDVQNILHYKPNLYSNPFNPEVKSKPTTLKSQNYVLNEHKEFLEQEKSKTIKLEDENNLPLNTCPNLENTLARDNLDDSNLKQIIQNEEKEKISKDRQIKYKYKLSDVFNLRKEPVFLNKSAEKYMFKEKPNLYFNDYVNTCPNLNNVKEKEKGKEQEKENNFYVSSESRSDWIPNKLNMKKMNTYSSVGYNILSPNFQGSNRFITATELNKDNLYNESPTFHRVKSISEFIDLTRVSATNTLECFNRNVNTKIPDFKLKNSVATNQLDEYHINRDLIEKPI
mgnify:CR=1 FL=1